VNNLLDSIDRATLLRQTIDWLASTQLLFTIDERKQVLRLAGFEGSLLGLVVFEGSASVFSARLLNQLLDYEPLADGKKLITNVLETMGASLGVDHQSKVGALIRNFNAYSPSPGDTPGSGDREHITSAERPSLWIGVPDLPHYGLVGRDKLLTGLVNQLSTGTAVSLSAEGKGGVDKTALAVALAHRRDLL
jgi:hypothetical protein